MTARLVVSLLALSAVLPAPAADTPGCERRVKVALALAAAKRAPSAVAPAPHEAAKSYPEGYTKAATDQMPLVVFVGCERHWPVKGAIVAKATGQFAGVDGPAVVVGYPSADRLLIDTILSGEPEKAKVADAVKAAAKKIGGGPAKSMPAAPKPLDWNL